MTPLIGLLDTPPQVLLTNVLYYDDAEMQGLLQRKHAEYPQGTTFFTSMHELGRPVANFSGDTLVIDSLNFYVSNIILLCNSDPKSVPFMRETIKRDIEHLLASLVGEQASFRRLLVLTGEVDFDYFIRTEAGIMYRQLIYMANSLIASAAQRYGLLTNGTILWVKA